MLRAQVGTRYRKPVVGLALSGMLLAGLAQGSADAQVTELNGSAYGAFVSVGLFGGPASQIGADPFVVLPAEGGSESQVLPEIIGQYGPAVILGGEEGGPTGELTVSTEGETGPDAFVTSSASVVDPGPGPFIAEEASSTCTADADGVTGSATITGGTLVTSTDVETQEAVTTENIPESPEPNTAIEGTLDHVGDNFRAVFNEQIVDGDTIIVRALHLYLLGNIAIGDLIIGQSVCGLSADTEGTTTPPTVAVSSGTAADESATATTAADTEATDGETTDTETTDTETTEAADEGDEEAVDGTLAADESDGGSSALPIVLAVVVVLGLVAAFVVVKRRRPATTET